MVLVFLQGCATFSLTRSWYGYDLASDSKIETQSGRLTISELKKDMIAIKFENKGSSSAKIIWDESVLVDTNGKTHRIVHEGVKLAKSGESMPPTLVPAGAVADDIVAYADGVSFNTFGTGSWTYTELIPCSTPGAICSNDEYLGKHLTLLLTVESDGKKTEYTGKLRIKKAQ